MESDEHRGRRAGRGTGSRNARKLFFHYIRDAECARAGMDGKDRADHALVDVDLRVALFEHARELGNVGFGGAAADDEATGVGGNERADLLEALARAARVAAEIDLALQLEDGAKVERRFRLRVVETAAADDGAERLDRESDADLPL